MSCFWISLKLQSLQQQHYIPLFLGTVMSQLAPTYYGIVPIPLDFRISTLLESHSCSISTGRLSTCSPKIVTDYHRLSWSFCFAPFSLFHSQWHEQFRFVSVRWFHLFRFRFRHRIIPAHVSGSGAPTTFGITVSWLLSHGLEA